MYDKINYMSKVSKIDKNIKYKFSKEEKKDIASLKMRQMKNLAAP